MIIDFTRIIDLSHPITDDMPLWPGDPPTTIARYSTVAQDGYALNSLTIGEHSGTHIGAPTHFNQQGWSVDHIPIDRLVVPAINLDMSDKVHNNADFLLTCIDIEEWERKNGQIENECVVLLKTGWSALWCKTGYFSNDQSDMHFPGITEEAAEFLIQKRKIIGLGIDTAGIDGGQSVDFAVNRLLAEHNIYHLENLNLQALSAIRLYIAIGALPIQNGNGSPCRIFGLIKD